MNLKAMRLGMLKMKAWAKVEAISTRIKPSRVLRLPNLKGVDVKFAHHVLCMEWMSSLPIIFLHGVDVKFAHHVST